jgi:hypothetical protein
MGQLTIELKIINRKLNFLAKMGKSYNNVCNFITIGNDEYLNLCNKYNLSLTACNFPKNYFKNELWKYFAIKIGI